MKLKTLGMQTLVAQTIAQEEDESASIPVSRPAPRWRAGKVLVETWKSIAGVVSVAGGGPAPKSLGARFSTGVTGTAVAKGNTGLMAG